MINKSRSVSQEDVLEYLEKVPSGITFIHGKAGCGKTYLINKLVKMVGGCQVLTPTNLVASLYKGARTIHSYFHGGLDGLDEGFQNPANLQGRILESFRFSMREITMLIIDEISMVRADLFEMMNQICKRALNNDKPFGGIPIVVVGDLFQLPPIVSDDAVLEYLKCEYGGIYFFNSHVIQKEIQHVKFFELTKSYRQANDPDFVKILDAFRQPMSADKKVKVMNLINGRVTNTLPNDAVYVASSNEEVRQVNTNKLCELPGLVTTINAEYTILKKDWTGHVTLKHSQLPSNEDVFEIVVPSAYDSQFTFKKGARVMLCRNSKPRYLNGDFGTIEDFNGQYFTIKIDRTQESVRCPDPFDRYKASQMNEYRYEMEYDNIQHHLTRKKPFVQKTHQYPIKLAYAFTIHKAQGQTYEKVILDLNSHIFAPGQLYVALSRAKSLQGLFLTKPVTYSDIISDESIFVFLNKIRMYNGQGNPIADPVVPQPQKKTSDSVCESFANVIHDKERSASSQKYMLHVLNSFKVLVAGREYEKACWELQKVIDILISTYEVDNQAQLLGYKNCDDYSESGCRSMLSNIFVAYQKVLNQPLKQYQSENRTIPLELSA